MAKKKQGKLSNILTQILQFKEIISAITVVVLWLLAVWFTYRIAPITQRINGLEYKVLANESSISDIKEDVVYIKNRIDYIGARVDDIYKILAK